MAVPNDVEEALLELERAGWNSLCNASGSDFYGQAMLANALMVLANGMVMDRDTVVASLSKSPPWRDYEISDVRSTPTPPFWCTRARPTGTAKNPRSWGR
jgi:hypothetical protein